MSKSAVVPFPEISDPTAEAAVIGSILLRPESIKLVCDSLEPEHFQIERHRVVYRAMLALDAAGAPVDLPAVVGALFDSGKLEAAGGPEQLADLADNVGTAANIEYHARRIINKHLLREVRQRAKEIVAATERPGDNVAEVLDFAEGALFGIGSQVKRGNMTTAGLVSSAELNVLEEVSRGTTQVGIPTGWRDLDRRIALAPGDMAVLAARPSMGKTAMGLNLAVNAARRGYHVAVNCLEMTNQQLVRRCLSALSGIDYERINRCLLTPDDWPKLNAAHVALNDLPLYLDDTPGLTLYDIRSQARNFKARGKLDLLIVDYLQLVKPHKNRRSREEEISEISRGTKATAKELGIPVLMLAQLNRDCEKRPDKRPQLSDLRESGAIEQDTDLAMFLYRDEVYHKDSADAGTCEVLIRKQRNGRIGTVVLRFDAEHQIFQDLAYIT